MLFRSTKEWAQWKDIKHAWIYKIKLLFWFIDRCIKIRKKYVNYSLFPHGIYKCVHALWQSGWPYALSIGMCFLRDYPSMVSLQHLSKKVRIDPSIHLSEEWIQMMWCIYALEYYLAIKKEEILLSSAAWMELDGIVLSEISQTEKDNTWFHLYVESKKHNKTNKTKANS